MSISSSASRRKRRKKVSQKATPSKIKSATTKKTGTPSDNNPEKQPEDNLGKQAGSRPFDRIALTILATLAILYTIYFARAILFPIALAVVLFFLLSPLVRLMTRVRMLPESVSAALVVLSLTTALTMGSYVLSGPVSAWFANAPDTFRQAEEKLRFLIEPVLKLDHASEEVTKIAQGSSQDGVVEVAIRQPLITNHLLNATMNFVAGATINIVLVYLLLAMGHRTMNSVVELIPTIQDKRGFVTMIREVEQGISRYLLTITAINIGLGIVIGTALGLLGMPDPILLGIMAATLNFIPFLGCLVGAAVTFLIGIVYLDTPAQALLGPVIYLIINTLEGNVLTPMILGRSMKLNPVIVFLSIVFWGWVWGVGGILIAVPMLGILKIACDNHDRLSPVARILSG